MNAPAIVVHHYSVLRICTLRIVLVGIRPHSYPLLMALVLHQTTFYFKPVDIASEVAHCVDYYFRLVGLLVAEPPRWIIHCLNALQGLTVASTLRNSW